MKIKKLANHARNMRDKKRPVGNGKHRIVTAKYPDEETSRTRPCEESDRPGKSDQGGGKTDLTANFREWSKRRIRIENKVSIKEKGE